jgi:RNA polymerase sigma-70 factor (family 1)
MYHTSLHDEKMWLLQVAEGDQKAFRILFDQYHQRLGLHIFRLTKSHEMAEEIVLDVFLKIWINRASLAEIQNFQAYLYVMSKNHALNSLKKLAIERIATAELELADSQTHFDESPDDNERYLLIDEAIDHLPPQQQKVYLLSRHGLLKQSQIAEELNLSKETVKKYLKIASESIRCYIRKKLVSSLPAVLLYFF